MKIYWIGDWKERDNKEKTEKSLKTFTIFYGVLTLVCIIGLFISINTATANISVSNRLPQSPDKPHKVITATLTAYTPEVSQTDSTPFLTANQSPVKEGGIACPRNIKFGTLIEVFGKRYVCNDRMALKNDGKFDIFMFNKEEALNFGRKVANVKIY
jgi:3D (Asp-Asp-Asp) domain-containing protein